MSRDALVLGLKGGKPDKLSSHGSNEGAGLRVSTMALLYTMK